MKTHFIFFSFLIFISINLFAQEPPKVKFEKVSEDEIKMTTYEKDTAAVAVILYDEGYSEVRYIINKGFTLNYERFVRIKILKQTGTDWGTFSIPLYSSFKSNEEIGSIKGTTFNFENGKIVKTEMKKESVFRERENKYWEMVRFSLPAVKAGSVIDLKYSVSSPFLWNLRSWDFQYLIPVKWSLYQVKYPEYFVYNHSSLGYHPLNSQNHTTGNEQINYTSTSTTNQGGLSGSSGREMGMHTIDYLANIYNFSAKDVPAMKEEPFMTTLENYTTKVKFELAVTDFLKIGGEYKSYTNSWDDIKKDLLNDPDFGGQIKSANFAKDEITSLTKDKKDEKEKLTTLYNYVQHTIKWDKTKSYMPSKSIRKTFIDKTGNSAEVNLLLIGMLNEIGIEANPIILSTRENGIISPLHATLSDCNYIIASAIIDGKTVLLDATESNMTIGNIPFRCLNGQGRMLKKDETAEIELTNPKPNSTTIINAELKDGKIIGKMVSFASGLNAFDFREKVKDAGGEKEYFEKLRDKSDEFQITDYSYTNLDDTNQPIEKKYDITFKKDDESEAELIYINPVLVNQTTKNPFTSPKRDYPIDFGSLSSESYQLNLIIPDGYEVEELPKSKSIGLEGNSGSFIYKIGKTDNIISCSTRFSLNKSLFLPAEYEMLKEFYNILVSKEAEQIVLKKIIK